MLRNFKTSKRSRTNYIYYPSAGQPVTITPNEGDVTYTTSAKFHNWIGTEVGANGREDRVIFIGNEAIPVTKEVYQTYYKMDRRARYLEEDIKVGKRVTDPVTGEVIYKPSKEDSIERLSEQGVSFKAEQSVEDIACDNAMLLLLNKAKEILDKEELKLINALYDQELTYRQAGEILNISHVAVQKRHNKILDKLRKYFL